jgi:hypothetical protein
MDGAGFFALFVAVGAIGASLLLGPVGQAVGRWIEHRIAPHPREHEDGELLRVHQRMAELEERVDFSERLLAQQRETGQLRGPG